jgi:hypothetical protein
MQVATPRINTGPHCFSQSRIARIPASSTRAAKEMEIWLSDFYLPLDPIESSNYCDRTNGRLRATMSEGLAQSKSSRALSTQPVGDDEPSTSNHLIRAEFTQIVRSLHSEGLYFFDPGISI